MLKPFKKLHFIGIGGIGMSGLAGILLSQGATISGSDLKHNRLTQELQAQGATIYTAHSAEQVPADADYVVVSTAISEHNPEYIAAQTHRIPIIHRSAVLAHLLAKSRGISITGTHGKTTTSALMSLILYDQGLDPTIVIGGEVPQLGTNARAGQGAFTVAEVDESDQSLRQLSSEMVLITNLEVDHLDHYKGLDEIIEAVMEFLNNQPPAARIFVNLDDAGVQALLAALPEHKRAQCISFALKHPDADYRLSAPPELLTRGSRFSIAYQGQSLGNFEIGIPGLHNIANALGALACSHYLGLDLNQLAQTLKAYQGVKRRFQHIGDLPGGVSVIDDYGHHPSEIKATLTTARLQQRPVTAVFQPHRYSRTAALLHDFAASFEQADRIILTDIYAASENPADFVIDIHDLVSQTRALNPDKTVLYFPDLECISQYLLANLHEQELILTIGAGNITELSGLLLAGKPAAPNSKTEQENNIVYAPIQRGPQRQVV
ncbi:MAG: UDP-N-acetylmuramate--L-alanine ligase [Candidatus Sericytochromatia bacterium]|nr:UDP-N-acetylmuramate--L-alanine ligase [Candidatus Sericytochromatia bacterium]